MVADLLGFFAGGLNQGPAAAKAALELFWLLGLFVFGAAAGGDFAGWLGLVLLFAPFDALAGKADLALFAIDAKDLHLDLVADFDDVFGVFDFVVGELRN